MTFAPWSTAYIVPFLAYGYYVAVHRRTVLDPLLIGGGYLTVMFLMHERYQQAFPTHTLWLLHLLASASYWTAGLFAQRQASVWHPVQRCAPRFVLRRTAWVWLALVALAISGFIFGIMFQASPDLMLHMRNRPELMLGSVVSDVSTLERLAQYLRGYLCAAAAFTVFLWCRRVDRRPLSILLLMVSLASASAILAAGGSRGFVVFLGVHCYFALHYAIRGRQNTRFVAKIFALACIPLVAFTILTQTLYRDTGITDDQQVQLLRERSKEAVLAILEHVSFNDEVQFVLANYPSSYAFTEGHSLITPFVVWVPRPMWPEKPIPWGRDLAWQYGYRYETTVSLAATIIGEGYANFGLLGWMLFPAVFGGAIGWMFHFLRHSRDDFDMLFGLWAVYWALALRGDYHTVISASIFPAGVLIASLRCLAFKRVSDVPASFYLHDRDTLDSTGRSAPLRGLAVRSLP
ncbi:MAG: oligosaccharide repeat unit polymerase [Bryobacteraceae bacterium]|nr:oligosaccharide repeat unit polymerase [Bryobacteraceae bacterium]